MAPPPTHDDDPRDDEAAWMQAQCRVFREALADRDARDEGVSAEDRALFEAAVAGDHEHARTGRTAGAAGATAAGVDDASQRLFEEAVATGAVPEPGDEEDAAACDSRLRRPGDTPAVAWNTLLRELGRGRRTPDCQIDLHGLHATEALLRLEVSLGSAQARGHRLVLVVTGEGLHSKGRPTLRSHVERWLRTEGSAVVGNWAPAPRRLGGLGAFLVLLKRPPAAGTNPLP